MKITNSIKLNMFVTMFVMFVVLIASILNTDYPTYVNVIMSIVIINLVVSILKTMVVIDNMFELSELPVVEITLENKTKLFAIPRKTKLDVPVEYIGYEIYGDGPSYVLWINKHDIAFKSYTVIFDSLIDNIKSISYNLYEMQQVINQNIILAKKPLFNSEVFFKHATSVLDMQVGLYESLSKSYQNEIESSKQKNLTALIQ